MIQVLKLETIIFTVMFVMLTKNIESIGVATWTKYLSLSLLCTNMTRKYNVYCRKSMRQDYSSYMVTVHFKSFLYKLVSRSDIISGHQTNDKKCWKGLNLAILNHFIFLQSNYFSPFKLFCFTITCCYTLLSQKSLVYRVFFIMQMLIYEFMSNGNLRDHLSGKFELVLF